ncbi:hypothetical protein FGO68_gene12665 [Halteria grandinella]|uniref:Uncharacterized protein n=1 Tax=Halteria grandinella TaxID=5974 RepID=A0A8J8NGV7_HALGN|nr:hypothetical protein FGO68_gene12665 [Halteria grandinella]
MLTTTQPYHQAFATQSSTTAFTSQPLQSTSISSAKFNNNSVSKQTPSFKVVHQAGKPMSATSAIHASLTFNGKENVDSTTTSGSGSSTLSQQSIGEASFKRQQRANRAEEQEISSSQMSISLASKKKAWSASEDTKLLSYVEKFGDQRWNKVSKCMPGRSEIQCFNRWLELKNDTFVSKGPWTKEEDEILKFMVEEHGAKNWSTIAAALPGRIGKQCRERWHNHLDPNIRKEKWSAEEDRIILEMHQEHGNKWCEIAKSLPGRTDNAIKNRFNSKLKKYANNPNYLQMLPLKRSQFQQEANEDIGEEDDEEEDPEQDDKIPLTTNMVSAKGSFFSRSFSTQPENSSQLLAGLKMLSSLAAGRSNSWSGANSGNENSQENPSVDADSEKKRDIKASVKVLQNRGSDIIFKSQTQDGNACQTNNDFQFPTTLNQPQSRSILTTAALALMRQLQSTGIQRLGIQAQGELTPRTQNSTVPFSASSRSLISRPTPIHLGSSTPQNGIPPQRLTFEGASTIRVSEISNDSEETETGAKTEGRFSISPKQVTSAAGQSSQQGQGSYMKTSGLQGLPNIITRHSSQCLISSQLSAFREYSAQTPPKVLAPIPNFKDVTQTITTNQVKKNYKLSPPESFAKYFCPFRGVKLASKRVCMGQSTGYICVPNFDRSLYNLKKCSYISQSTKPTSQELIVRLLEGLE